jgi:hypothetical protein
VLVSLSAYTHHETHRRRLASRWEHRRGQRDADDFFYQ